MTIEMDLRAKLLPVRDQGFRPTCLAFAASEIHSLKHNFTDWLSPEYLYHRAGSRMKGWDCCSGLTFEDVVSALMKDGQPAEHHCPYQLVSCDAVKPVGKHKEVVSSASIHSSVTPAEVYKKGLTGSVVVLGLNITQQFQAVIGSPYIIDFEGAPEEGGHAVVLSGLAKDSSGKKLFRIKNSWGADWAEQGHVWLTEKFLKNYLFATLEVA